MKYSGKTVEEAIERALKQLNCTIDEVNVEVVQDTPHRTIKLLGENKVVVNVVPKAGADDEFDLAMSEGEEPYEEQGEPVDPKEFLETLLSKMGLEAEVKLLETEEGTKLDIKGEELAALIGRHGETLEALQYIVNIIGMRHDRHIGTSKRTRYILDIEGYRLRREEQLKALAVKVAEKAIREQKEMVLQPMPASERRIIHMVILGIEGVTSYSEGNEPNRKVVVSPE
ncbi:MAG TPA: RNA-binding cell elongation regulator Jag/EloR [Bacillota bacterium]|nr:RNA-binding cell elongation regulator Jag/EloR [Bacillota bacterium]HOH10863.1 RNA-binding cell elongation regulator Jag/EloR [Bacillota bacterium]HOY88336.1 RNA-binding cell elongation regulator Jag/EloR [Bacillota bacterium]HPI00808.1 RNA-binding cell elongation regulator Jag/EloR [Bacillota bacterium]HPM63991.1 RNA-binding cell elongation regulator Jag/EloR [Bacillota bacterium]